jgi:hypothetical protein
MDDALLVMVLWRGNEAAVALKNADEGAVVGLVAVLLAGCIVIAVLPSLQGVDLAKLLPSSGVSPPVSSSSWCGDGGGFILPPA